MQKQTRTIKALGKYCSFLSMAVINYPDQKQSLTGKNLFDLQAQVTVHYRREVTVQDSKTAVHIIATGKSRRENAPMLLSGLPLAQLAFFILRQSRAQPMKWCCPVRVGLPSSVNKQDCLHIST